MMKLKPGPLLVGVAIMAGCGGVDSLEDYRLGQTPISSVPSADAECRAVSSVLKIPDNAAGVMFDESCSSAFVLPPIKGKASLTRLAKSSNLGFCSAVHQTGEVAARTLESAAAIAKNVQAMIESYSILDEGIRELRNQVVEAKASRDEAQNALQDAEGQSTRLKDEYIAAGESLQLCNISGRDCQEIQERADRAQQAFAKHFEAVLLPSRQESRRKNASYELAAGRLTNESNRYSEATAPLLALQGQLFDLNSQVMELYREWTTLEGATGQIVYNVAWDQLVQDFKDLNPNVGVSFSPVRVIDAAFHATSKAQSGENLRIPALLSATIPGAKPHGINHPPKGEAIKSDGVDVDLVSSGFTTFTGAGVNSVSGQIVLSLAGACAYYDENNDDQDRSEVSHQELSAHMVANAELVYEVKARRKYDAEYHMGMWLSRVERKSKRGGFFSSSNLHSIVEDGDSSDWFKITFDENSSEFGYSADEQNKITAEVKADLIDRSMRQVAMQNGFQSSPPPIPGLQPSGVGVAARNINRGCWWWSYCRSAGYVLGVLDSVFGRSEAVSNFKKQNNSWTRESVNQVKVLRRSALVTFSDPDQNKSI